MHFWAWMCFSVLGARGIPQPCLLPWRGESLAPCLLSLHSGFHIRQLYPSSGHAVATTYYRGAPGSPGSQGEQWHTYTDARGASCHQKMLQHRDRWQAQCLHLKQEQAQYCGADHPYNLITHSRAWLKQTSSLQDNARTQFTEWGLPVGANERDTGSH